MNYKPCKCSASGLLDLTKRNGAQLRLRQILPSKTLRRWALIDLPSIGDTSLVSAWYSSLCTFTHRPHTCFYLQLAKQCFLLRGKISHKSWKIPLSLNFWFHLCYWAATSQKVNSTSQNPPLGVLQIFPQLIVANDSSWKGTCDDNSLCRNDQSSAIGHMKHGGEGYEDQEGRGDWQGVCLGQADRKSPPAHHWPRTRKTRWTNRWVLLNNETILDASLHHTAGAEIPILLAWGPYIHVACVKTGLCQRLKWISSAWQWAYFGSMLGHNLHNLWPKALCTETRNVNRVLPRQVEYQHES